MTSSKMLRWVLVAACAVGFALVACKAGLRPGKVHCGALQLNTTPTGAQVWLDTTAQEDTTDCLIDSVPAGKHTVTLVKPSYLKLTVAIEVVEGKTATVETTLAAVAYGKVQVNSSPTGAAVWLDTVATGDTTNCLLDSMVAGIHSLKLVKSGFADWYGTVTVVAGQTAKVTAVLASGQGALQVSSTPTGATVWLDSANTGKATNCLLANLAPGPHSLMLTKTGFEDWDTTVSVGVAETTSVSTQLVALVYGWVDVGSAPTGAAVWLDGVNTGRTTSCLLDSVLVGSHTLGLKLTGYADWDTTVAVIAGETTSVSPLLTAVTAGWVQVNSTPTGAAVWLDSVNTGRITNCLLVSVAAGSHMLELKLTGYADWDTTIAVVAGETTTVSALLTAVTAGWVQVNSTPTGASVWLDNSNTGRTTNCLLSDVTAGQHDIKLKLTGYVDWDSTITVAAGDTATVSAALVAVSESGLVYIGNNAQGFEEYLWLKDSSVVIRVPAGTFTMGSSINADEQPIHDVYLDEFYADKFEVTNKQYKRFCDATGRPYPDDPGFPGMDNYFTRYPDYPVVEVTWYDAEAYGTWAGKALLTEAQWEKAARGTDERTYPWGNEYPDWTRCNIIDNDGYEFTSPVGQFPEGASFYGCMDLAGNVWEWAEDWYGSGYYSTSPDSNPPGPTYGSSRVARGGSFNNTPIWVRCAERYWGGPGTWDEALGFRCCYVSGKR
jgi:formylglycine-generating enzyme required for sulfatase activity